MSSASHIVKQLINDNKVIIFSKTYCPYCDKAKSVLNSVGVKFGLIELDQRSDGNEIQNELNVLTGRRTVPNVFIGGKSIGGGDDTVALHREGKLITKLKEIGAL